MLKIERALEGALAAPVDKPIFVYISTLFPGNVNKERKDAFHSMSDKSTFKDQCKM